MYSFFSINSDDILHKYMSNCFNGGTLKTGKKRFNKFGHGGTNVPPDFQKSFNNYFTA